MPGPLSPPPGGFGPPQGDPNSGFALRKLIDMNMGLAQQNQALLARYDQELRTRDERLAALYNQIAGFQSQQVRLQEQLASLSEQARQPSAKYVEDIPGRREPFIYSIDFTFETTNATATPAAQSSTFTVSQDGPFVATGVTAVYRVTSPTTQASFGRWRPVSSADPAFTITELGTAQGVADAPFDFEIEISDSGSNRNIQNNPIPSHLLGRGREFWWNFDAGWFLERNSAVRAVVTPLHPIGTASTTTDYLLRVSFPGYKILQPIDYKP